jgi:hypothetical protein
MHKNNIGDIILSFASFFQIVVLMFQQLLIDSNIVEHESFRKFSIFLSAIPMVFAMIFIIKRRFVLVIITYISIMLLLLLTLIFFPDNEQYLAAGAFYLLCINIPCFLSLASIRDIDVLKRIMLYLSYVIFGLGIIYVLFILFGRIIFSTYSMSFSYYLLLPAVIFVSKRKILFFFLFIIVCMLMLMLGSRGALIAGFLYAFSLSFIDRRSRRHILLLTIITVILSGSLLSIFLTLFDRVDISSRTLNMLQQGSFTEPSGRLDIYSKTWNSLLDSPFWGNGIYGDRVILDGNYCHNIFLEMFQNFGILFGTGLILFLFYIAVRLFFKSDTENRKILLLFFCFGFIPLLFSGSYLNDSGFGIFIGSLFYLSKTISTNHILQNH